MSTVQDTRDRVTFREVGLRDGLQMVRTYPSSEAKQAWLAAEARAGVGHFEIGSFLPADRFPQFADIGALIAAAQASGVVSSALVLNDRGAGDALVSGIDEMVCVVSATEAHSMANARRTRAEAVALVGRVAARRAAEAPDKRLHVGIAMAFGCSLEGAVDPEAVLRLCDAVLDAGADTVGLADTVGHAGPRDVATLCRGLAGIAADRPFAIHLHDTRGLGLANAAAALDTGARLIDASLGGLGGCPFAPGATGNIVFEDAVFLAESMGFATGIDIAALSEARAIAEAAMPGEAFHGAILRAGLPKGWDAVPA